jgi:hypothetical protein
MAYPETTIGETSFERGPGLKIWIAPESGAGSGRLVAVGVGSRLGVGINVGPLVATASIVGVFPGVCEYSGVGAMVADSVGSAVGWVVTVGIWVPVGTRVGTADACLQAVRKASRVQVKITRRCILKLYP